MEQRPDILFSNVPVVGEPEFIQRTFINRERELNAAKMLFQPNRLKDQIYAIHGFSRVGKSHLAIKLALDLSSQHNMLYFYTSANMKGTAEDVLGDLYEKIRNYTVSLDPKTIKGKDRSAYLAFLKVYLNHINLLFTMPAAKISFRFLQKEAEKVKANLGAKVPFVNLSAGIAGERTKGADKEQAIELGQPNAKGIRLIICFLIEALAFISDQNFLLLVDDLDLLEETSGGAKERDELINQLKHIALAPCVAVWVTCRQQYFTEREKEMDNFIQVSFLKEAELVDIYKARVREYYGDAPIFGEEALQELTEGFRGVAGSFLNECFLFWRHHLGETYPLGLKHLSAFLLAEMENFLGNPETHAIFTKITDAVKTQKTEVEIPDVKKGQGLIYRVLFPKAYGQDIYEISPLFAKVLKNRIG